jgi:hypothetical protein
MPRKFKVVTAVAPAGALGLSAVVAWPRLSGSNTTATPAGERASVTPTKPAVIGAQAQGSTAQIIANAETVQPGGIILFQDGYQSTLDALPKIVDNLAPRALCAGKIAPSPDPIVTGWDQTFYARVVHW